MYFFDVVNITNPKCVYNKLRHTTIKYTQISSPKSSKLFKFTLKFTTPRNPFKSVCTLLQIPFGPLF